MARVDRLARGRLRVSRAAATAHTEHAHGQTYLQFATDLVAVALLIHASGGISSGLGGVLIVSVGTLALLLPTERAFLLAAVSTLVLARPANLRAAAGHHDRAPSSRRWASSAPSSS